MVIIFHKPTANDWRIGHYSRVQGFLVAPLEPKVKINKTLQINDLRRFSFAKNRHFRCKMKQFSVLFMDIFWIPQKCTRFFLFPVTPIYQSALFLQRAPILRRN